MTLVKEGDTITIHYKAWLDDGTVFDSSEDRKPLSFKVGDDQVIQGFDDGVRGMAAGESRQINIPADQAYGEYYEELVRVVPRSGFSRPIPLQPLVWRSKWNCRPENQ